MSWWGTYVWWFLSKLVSFQQSSTHPYLLFCYNQKFHKPNFFNITLSSNIVFDTSCSVLFHFVSRVFSDITNTKVEMIYREIWKWYLVFNCRSEQILSYWPFLFWYSGSLFPFSTMFLCLFQYNCFGFHLCVMGKWKESLLWNKKCRV